MLLGTPQGSQAGEAAPASEKKGQEKPAATPGHRAPGPKRYVAVGQKHPGVQSVSLYRGLSEYSALCSALGVQ